MNVDGSVDVVLKGLDGTFYLIRCRYFIPYKGLNVYEVYNSKHQDKIHCGRGEAVRRKGYYERNVTRCLVCAVRHGYVVKTSHAILVEKRR